MKNLLAVLLIAGVCYGCGDGMERDTRSKEEVTKQWQDKSDVPQGYRDASAGMAGGGGAPKGSGPVNPPPGVTGGN